MLALPWLWLQRTWAVHDFRCVVVGGSEPRWRGRLAQLPSAVAAGWRAFRARRKARLEQQRLAREHAKAGRGWTFNWWWIFWGVFVLQALARLAK